MGGEEKASEADGSYLSWKVKEGIKSESQNVEEILWRFNRNENGEDMRCTQTNHEERGNHTVQ